MLYKQLTMSNSFDPSCQALRILPMILVLSLFPWSRFLCFHQRLAPQPLVTPGLPAGLHFWCRRRPLCQWQTDSWTCNNPWSGSPLCHWQTDSWTCNYPWSREIIMVPAASLSWFTTPRFEILRLSKVHLGNHNLSSSACFCRACGGCIQVDPLQPFSCYRGQCDRSCGSAICPLVLLQLQHTDFSTSDPQKLQGCKCKMCAHYCAASADCNIMCISLTAACCVSADLSIIALQSIRFACE